MRATMAVAVVFAVALLVSGGAAWSASPRQIDLSSPAAVDAYLRSIGVDPATVVKQIGLHNYAGPTCPGPEWNCTTATRVVQLSNENGGHEDEGENEVVCKPKKAQVPTTDANTCIIVQSGRNNHARCEIEDSTTPLSREKCDVTQTGKKNRVEIDQDITQSGGAIQTAQQIAKVLQDASDTNVSEVEQFISQKTWSASQTQDGFQVADVDQFATGSQNYSHVHQAMDQYGAGVATSQKQNTIPTTDPQFNCGGEKPGNPNQCANISQDAPGGGINASLIHQRIGEQQTSTAMTQSQEQGNADGGQEGDVHQENPTGIGQNLNFPDQDLAQLQSSPDGTAAQTQVTDPGCCGAGTQFGGRITRELIRQKTVQSADEPLASQFASLFGQTHQLSGLEPESFPLSSTTPENSCRIEQTGQNNSTAETFTASGDSQAECADLVLATECESAGGEGDCFPASTCPECTLALRSPAAPTFGLAIAMPDYEAEPATYFPPSP